MNARIKRCLIAAAALTVAAVLTWWLLPRKYATQTPPDNTAAKQHEEALLRANAALVKQDSAAISAYAQRNGWQLQVSPSGLWYEIYRHGKGAQAAAGQTIELAYTVSLADSSHTLCYSSDQQGLLTFRIGQGGVPAGLEEGVLLLRTGDRARLVLPPHLAYGIPGDGNRIPRRATIVYDVEVKRVF
jgi:FKBP-type peptidyl-prolyl cis-trans isomerase